jgi:uncharacterized protein DUF4397
MRRILDLSVLCILGGLASGCLPAGVTDSEVIPTAGVRFINAVPDTGGAFGLDFRFVDFVENSSTFRATFRNNPITSGGVTASSNIQYKNAKAGSRHVRIFLDDTLQAAASTVLKDSTVNLEAGHNYTFLLWGNARSSGADRMKLTVIDETVADPGANVALRVINASGSAVDVRQYTGSTIPPGATWANVAAYTIANYVTAPPAQIRFNVQPAGGGTVLFTDALALIGQATTVDIEGTPGTTQAGSAVTMVVFPRSVAGSRATSFTTPGFTFMWDRRPKRSCPLC